MAAATRQRTSRTWRWTALVHALVFAFVLAVVGPLPAEAAPHAHHAHLVPEATLTLTSDQPAAAGDSDACLICHHHCSCHQAACLDAPAAPMPPVQARVTYRPITQQLVTISTDSLLRPPRA